MKIVIEKGRHGWFAVAHEVEGLYRGLLVVADSLDEVLDQLSEACKELRLAEKENNQ